MVKKPGGTYGSSGPESVRPLGKAVIRYEAWNATILARVEALRATNPELHAAIVYRLEKGRRIIAEALRAAGCADEDAWVVRCAAGDPNPARRKG